jgi:hypothetical protein
VNDVLAIRAEERQRILSGNLIKQEVKPVDRWQMSCEVVQGLAFRESDGQGQCPLDECQSQIRWILS